MKRVGFCEISMASLNRLRIVFCVFIVLFVTAFLVISYYTDRDSVNDVTDDGAFYNHNWQNKHSLTGENITGHSVSRWVVISIAVTRNMPEGYVFCIPLTVAAWRRIGWHSLIIVTGNIAHWNSSNLLKIVKQTTLDIDNMARFVYIPVAHNPVSYAQVSRLFAARFAHMIQPEDIVMTSDIDIVPLNGDFYDIVYGNEIFILNADCCSSFSWQGQDIKMQPMTSIGMNARNWVTVMDLEPMHVNETIPFYINTWLATHYGRSIPNEDVKKGENENWYLDQRVVSVQLHFSNIRKNKVRRVTTQDRADRSSSGTWHDFKKLVDAHMFLDSFEGSQWDKTRLLINDIFTDDIVDKLKLYKEIFVNVKTQM